MKASAVLLAVALPAIAGLAACNNAGSPSQTGSIDPSLRAASLNQIAAAAAVSAYRAQHGLPPVVIDPTLIQAATTFASLNAQNGELSHDVGGGFSSRMAAVGLGRSVAAENISAGADSFDRVLARWIVSPTHNENLLMPQIRRIGVARVNTPGGRYRNYWAMVMAGG